MAATPLVNTITPARTGTRYDNVAVAADNVNGNSVVNDGNLILALINGAGAQTVVVKSVAVADSTLTPPSLTINLAASQSFLTSRFNPAVWGGVLVFTASAATVTVIPIEVTG